MSESKLDALRDAASLSDVAQLLHFRPKAVAYILYKQAPEAKYRVFQIPKRNGGQRTIAAPVAGLKLLQRNLSGLLQDCVDEINRATNRRSRAAHGFIRKRSILTNARQHRHRRWVFNVDLEDFFPTINFGRVRGFLLKNRDFRLHEDVATVLAQIACHGNSLPQGSPCSPVLSNLIANLLDVHMVALASTSGCMYSRYADDLTFSTNKKRFPADIARQHSSADEASHLWLPGEELRRRINHCGFRLNEKKTRLMYRSSRQDVTGLVVNRKVNVRREYRHQVRAMVHRLITTGEFETFGVTQRGGLDVVEKRQGSFNELRGMLGFVYDVDSHNEEPGAAKVKPYRQFLIYSMFFAAERPVVLCEGTTDNVYLTHAIRSLAVDFPALAEMVSEDETRLKIGFYRYPQSSTPRILELRGGSGDLGRFIETYRTETRRFSGPGLKQPVVILYDNDDGARGVLATIKRVAKKEFNTAVTGTERYVRVFKNLYAVPTPGSPSSIEDFFDDSVKATEVGGKTFKAGATGTDLSEHYGKSVFARQVVARDATTIDFGGFRRLLGNLVAAIGDYQRVVAPGEDD